MLTFGVSIAMACLAILVITGRINRCSRLQMENSQRQKDSLVKEIVNSGKTIRFLDKKILSQENTIRALRADLSHLSTDYDSLVAGKEDRLNKAAGAPPDEAYDKLQSLYPDTAEKRFPFTSRQVKSLYLTHVENKHGRMQVSALELKVSKQEDLIHAQDSLIATGSAQVRELKKINSDQSRIIVIQEGRISALEKQAHSRQIWQVVAGASTLIAIVAIF